MQKKSNRPAAKRTSSPASVPAPTSAVRKPQHQHQQQQHQQQQQLPPSPIVPNFGDEQPTEGIERRARPPKEPIETGRGIVKQVLSGDRIVIYCESHSGTVGALAEKEIKLSNIKAPLPYAKWETGEREEEPFAWHSKDFLRKYIIGRPVDYVIEHAAGNRLYGTVFLTSPAEGEEVDVAKAIVGSGWALVSGPAPKEVEASANGDDDANPRRSSRSETLKILYDLQGSAKERGLGLHTKDKKLMAAAHLNISRPSRPQVEEEDEPSTSRGGSFFDATEMYKASKGVPLNAIIEHAISGSTLRVLLLPSLREILLKISGVQAPLLRRRPTPDEPFAREAHITTERNLLQRDVTVILSAYEPAPEDGRGEATFYGEVLVRDKSIGDLLLDSGLARFVEWSAPAGKAVQMKNLQSNAQKGRVRIWNAEQQILSAQKGSKDDFTGTVIEVPSAGNIVVLNQSVAPPVPVTVTLSSINTPRLTYSEKGDEYFAWEAREFVRRKLIGKRVLVSLDYTRPAFNVDEKERQGQGQPKPPGKEDKILPAKSFYTVTLEGRNIALGLIEHGYATLLTHRGENRSPHYDAFFLAQERAKGSKVGIHGNPDSFVNNRFNDISRTPAQAKKLFKSLETREGKRHKAIVEYVISGSRIKACLPAHSCLITFFLTGARCNSIPTKQQQEEGRAIPIGALEAQEFTRSLILHHDVEITIEGQDKSGAFRGHLLFKKRNLGLALLEKGLASYSRLDKGTDPAIVSAFETAENVSKENRVGIWVNYDPIEEERLRNEKLEEFNALSKPRRGLIQVTDVLNGSSFYYHIVSDDLRKLEELMEKLQTLGLDRQKPFAAEKNDAVAVYFSDNKWYRAVVTFVPKEKGGKYRVFYVDYGNVEEVDGKDLRKMPEELGEDVLPWQAHEGELAYIQTRPMKTEWGIEAAYALKDLVWGKTLLATVEYVEDDCSALTLFPSDDHNTFINGELVRAGLAKIPRRLPRGANYEVIDWLRKEQDVAYAKHSGIWEYGDDGEEDD